MSNKVCIWNISGISCNGEHKERLLFGNQIKVLICDAHFNEHQKIITLHSLGYDVEEVLNMAPEKRQEILNLNDKK